MGGSPLIAEQFTDPEPRIKVTKSGERVIVDHDLTITRVYMYLYLLLNIGAIIGETGLSTDTHSYGPAS